MTTSRQVDAMLQNARASLADAGQNGHHLGHALSQFHSALEEHFRWTLEQNEAVPYDIRLRLRNSRDVDRRQLLELMLNYGGLGAADAATIHQFNIVRNRIQHRNQVFRGTRRDVEHYARLVERLIADSFPAIKDAEIPDELNAAQRGVLGVPPAAPASPAGSRGRTEPMPRRDAREPGAPSDRSASRDAAVRRRQPIQPQGYVIGDWFMYALIGLIVVGVIWQLLH